MITEMPMMLFMNVTGKNLWVKGKSPKNLYYVYFYRIPYFCTIKFVSHSFSEYLQKKLEVLREVVIFGEALVAILEIMVDPLQDVEVEVEIGTTIYLFTFFFFNY